MARRHAGHSGRSRPRRRRAVFSLAALAMLATCAWMAPTVVVLTELRDRPLAAAFAGIDGRLTSGSARWSWLRGIEYRDIVLRSRDGRPVMVVDRLVLDRGLLTLALDARDLGTLRLSGVEAVIDVRRGGSSLEDLLAPWLAGLSSADGIGPTFDVELVDATVDLLDVESGGGWRLADVRAAGTIRPGAELGGWTVAGRVQCADPSLRGAASTAAVPAPRDAEPTQRLDRTTIAAGVAAILGRDGGWSLSSPAASVPGSRTITVATHRLPLGVSSVVARRFALPHVLDGLVDVRLDATVGIGERRIAGTVTAENVALCRAGTLAEVATLARCELPLDVSLVGDRLVVRRFAASSPLVRLEASGLIGLPRGGSWDWAERLIEGDFSCTADVDLAAVAKALPAGLAVKPDVRVTDGHLEFAAASRADGADRLLEIRATSRDLAAVQSVGGQERPLRWGEPFSAWLRGRRPSASGQALRIEDARLSSAAMEVSVSGDQRDMTAQWTLDVERLASAAGELFDLGGVRLGGSSRGRIEARRTDDAGGSVKASAAVSDFVLEAEGRPPWRDREITVETEGIGRITAGAASIESGRVVLVAGDDRFEAALVGGVIVAIQRLLGGDGEGPWVGPAPGAGSIAADCSLTGDLGRWHARAAGLVPVLGGAGLELGGAVEITAAVAGRGDAWELTKAGAQAEKLSVRVAGRRFTEPRVVATAAGLVHPATGQVDLSAGEILTATMSVRTGGLSWMPGRGTTTGGAAFDAILERLRGRMQWRANLGRLEHWLVDEEAAAAWQASGELAGTVEVVDAANGVNLLVRATGSQLAVTSGGRRTPAWSEPRATAVLELTRPHASPRTLADRVAVDALGVESSTFTLAARGTIDEWSSRRRCELQGSIGYDLEQLSRLAAPWTGGRVRFAGAGGRPFVIRGMLGGPPSPEAGTGARPAQAVTLPLPDEWLAATRGGDRVPAEIAARPVRSAAARVDRLAAGLRGVAVDTSLAWTSGEIDGFPVAAGDIPIRLVEGQLAMGPFDLAAAGGRLRGAPWIGLMPPPGELVVPPGRVLDHVTLAPQLCDRFVSWVFPLLGHATHTTGAVTVDLAGARIPLGDPTAGELAAQVVFDQLEAVPEAGMQPLVNLLVRLQTVLDPRFQFGDKAVVLRVRPEPVRVRMSQRRFWHEGLVMDTGRLSVRSAGSVGADGSLAMTVEVALRGDLVGQAPVVGQLLRTPLVIPLKGTVQKPQFDARAIDLVIGRVVENTAEAVIKDGLGRGLESLETLFGNPAPPAP